MSLGASGLAQTWSTAGVPETEQFASWQEVANDAFCPVTVSRDQDGPFASQVSVRTVGAVSISRITSSAQTVTRAAHQTVVQSGEVVFLNLPLSPGTLARQDGRTASLAAGDFTIVDSSRPFELDFERSFDQISVALPHDLIMPRLRSPAEITAVRVSGAQGVGAFASAALCALASDQSTLDRAAARSINSRLADLVALALSGATHESRPATRQLLIRSALEEIERSLADPNLAPADIAGRIYISSRYLHRLFTEHGISFGRWLLQRRLQRSHQMLSDPLHDGREISEIAYLHGFGDPSYFARAFNTRYGRSPRQLRQSVLADPAARDVINTAHSDY